MSNNRQQKKEPFDVETWGTSRILWLSSDQIESSMAYYAANRLDGIGISPHKGYKLRELSFLKEYAEIRAIVVANAKTIDISALQYLGRLRFISMGGNVQPFDFSAFPKLEEINVEWHPKLTLPSSSKTLFNLHLVRYRPKSADLTEISSLRSLERLGVVQSPIVSLKGIGELKKLQKLELHYLSKFEVIDEIENLSNSLKIFFCDFCRKIKNHEHVQVMRALEVLAFNDCGAMPTIKFIEKMPSLKDFRFVNTNVVDGDMKPCLRLEYAGFLKKRHYSHSPEEIERQTLLRDGY